MTRQELLKSPAYWEQKAQLDIYRCAVDFMQKHNMNRTQLADYLGVSKSYVSQLLSGDYNYTLEKMVDLSLKLGYVPNLEFQPISSVIYPEIKRNITENITKYIVSDKQQFNPTFLRLVA